MRKFTKEIASLLATVTVSASVNAANIQSEEIVQLAGQAVNPDSISEPLPEEITPTAGVVAPPDIYTEPETTVPPLMGDVAPETTTTTTVPPLMGTFVTTTATTTTETIPSVTGGSMPATTTTATTTTTEEIPSVAGGFMGPPTTTTTTTTLPPFMGTMTAATTTVVTTTTTSEEEMPPLMGEMAYVPGDVNGDYEFNVADIVALQRYILHMPESNINDWYQADLCEDGEINIFDLVVMRRELLRHMRYSDTSVFDK